MVAGLVEGNTEVERVTLEEDSLGQRADTQEAGWGGQFRGLGFYMLHFPSV